MESNGKCSVSFDLHDAESVTNDGGGHMKYCFRKESGSDISCEEREISATKHEFGNSESTWYALRLASGETENDNSNSMGMSCLWIRAHGDEKFESTGNFGSCDTTREAAPAMDNLKEMKSMFPCWNPVMLCCL